METRSPKELEDPGPFLSALDWKVSNLFRHVFPVIIFCPSQNWTDFRIVRRNFPSFFSSLPQPLHSADTSLLGRHSYAQILGKWMLQDTPFPKTKAFSARFKSVFLIQTLTDTQFHSLCFHKNVYSLSISLFDYDVTLRIKPCVIASTLCFIKSAMQ